jgi:hypothetical protein
MKQKKIEETVYKNRIKLSYFCIVRVVARNENTIIHMLSWINRRKGLRQPIGTFISDIRLIWNVLSVEDVRDLSFDMQLDRDMILDVRHGVCTYMVKGPAAAIWQEEFIKVMNNTDTKGTTTTTKTVKSPEDDRLETIRMNAWGCISNPEKYTFDFGEPEIIVRRRILDAIWTVRIPWRVRMLIFGAC